MATPVGGGDKVPVATPGLVEGRLVDNALVLSTVNHPLYQNGRNIDPGPGSQAWDADWHTIMYDAFGIKTYAHMGSRYPREGRKRALQFETSDRVAGLPFKLPLFTMGLKFSDLTPEEALQYKDRMLQSTLRFIGEIEAKEGRPLGMIHSAHLFLNNLIAGEINRRRAAGGLPYIPVVATAHGTALKFYKRESWFESMGATEPFGNPSKPVPNNIAIGPDVFNFLKEEFGELLSRKSEYAQGLGLSALEFLAELQTPVTVGYKGWVEPYIQMGVGAIVAISDENRVEVMKAFPDFPTENIHVIYNGFNSDVFGPMSLNRSEVLASLRTSKTTGDAYLPTELLNPDYVVVMTAKFVGWKGVDKLIKAAAGVDPQAGQGMPGTFSGYEKHFADQGKKVLTIIMGTNKDEPDLVKSYEELPGKLGLKNVVFLGHVTPEVVAKVNSIADVGVYPSQHEPFGMVAIESMAGGLPVLVGTGGFRNFVTEAEGGYVDPESPQNISSMVTESLQRNWRLTKGPDALKTAESYTWKGQFGKYLPIYEQVAGWVKNGHPKDVHHPRRVTYMGANRGAPLRQLYFSPYRVAMEVVKMVPEANASEAAVAATFVKCALRHGPEDGLNKTRAQIRDGGPERLLERIEAAKK